MTKEPGITVLNIKMLQEYFFETRKELTQVVGDRIGEILKNACTEHGNTTFIASGGNSPKEVYQHLHQLDLPWQDITVTLSDERWVSDNDPNSNEAMIRRELLINSASAAKFISLYSKDKSIESAVDEIETRLKTLTFPSACALLGMGLDGHIASLFPNADNLASAIDVNSTQLCCPITAPGLEQKRITLTAPVLLNTRHIILLIMGDEKRSIYEKAKHATDRLIMPVRVLLHQYRIPVEVYWSP